MFKYPSYENILQLTLTNEQNLVYVDMRQIAAAFTQMYIR